MRDGLGTPGFAGAQPAQGLPGGTELRGEGRAAAECGRSLLRGMAVLPELLPGRAAVLQRLVQGNPLRCCTTWVCMRCRPELRGNKDQFHTGKQKRRKRFHSGVLPSRLEWFLQCKRKGMVGWPRSSQLLANLNPLLLDIQFLPLLEGEKRGVMG